MVMNPDIYIISKDAELAQMLKIELGRRFPQVQALSTLDRVSDGALLIVDLDNAEAPIEETRTVICFSRFEERLPTSGKARGLLRPFRTSRLVALCEAMLLIPPEERRERILGIDRRLRAAIVDGVEIALTDCEFRLFAALLEARGEIMSNAALISAVWGEEERGTSLLPVYIHYLRKKLEGDRRKLIFAHRGGGYSIPSAIEAVL